MKSLKRYLKIWWLMSRNSFSGVFYARFSLFIFLFGKILRFSLFAAFIYFLLNGTKSLAGYSLHQTIFFFLTFNLIDVVSQFLFREVYRFRPLIVSGDFDLILVKPINVLFRVLFGGADLIDLITIPPLIISVFYVGSLLNPGILHTTLYILLLLNGFLISTAFHIAVLALGIVTLEIDHTIMIFRDMVSLGKLPVDIYKEPLRSILTFLLPIGAMITFPAKALMNLISWQAVLASFLVGAVSVIASMKLWRWALTKYSSASS